MKYVHSEEYQKLQSQIKASFTTKILISETAFSKEKFSALATSAKAFFQPFLLPKKQFKLMYNGKDKIFEQASFQLVSVQDQHLMSPETFQEKVGSTLQKLAPDLQKQVLFQKNIPQFLTNYKTPWFQEILDLSFQYTKNAFDTSLFDEPQALINVMFATEDNLKQQILKLSEPYQNSQHEFRAHIPKLNLIIQEEDSSVSTSDLVQLVSGMRSTYPNYQTKTIIYSTNTEQLTNTQQVFDDFLTDLLQNIRNRMSSCHASILQNKKGIANSFFGFFKNKERDSTNDYVYSPVDIQCRTLADFLFLFRDYEGALQYYKLLVSDLKVLCQWQNKSYKLFSNCLEMQTLCQVLTIQQAANYRKELENIVENFNASYKGKISYLEYMALPQTLSFALRSLLLKTSALSACNLFYLVSLIELESVSTQIKESYPAIYPVIIEQQALLQLRGQQPMVREFALRLAVAGNKYANQQQKKYAVLCYATVLQIYETVLFQKNDLYFYKHLLQFYLDEGEIELALGQQVRLLNQMDSRQNTEFQQKVVDECAQFFANKQLKSSIKIPKINPQEIDLSHSYENFQIVNNNYIGGKLPYVFGTDDRQSLWLPLAEKHFQLDEDQQNILTIFDCLTLQSKNALIKNNKIIYQNESNYVVFKATNPLKIAINMSQISLITDSEPILVQEDVMLGPLKEEIIQLKFKIESLGQIKVLGVKYTIFGIETDILFEFIGNKRPKFIQKTSTKYRFPEPKPCPKNVLTIKPATGLIEVNFPGYDQYFLLGEIRPIQYTIKNVGAIPIEKVEIVCNEISQIDQACIALDTQLDIQTSIQGEMVIRPTTAEQHEMHFLIKYTCTDGVARFYRCLLPVKATQQFDFPFHTEPCLQKNWVFLNIKNQVPQKSEQDLVSIKNIVLFNDEWSILERQSIQQFYIQKTQGQQSYFDEQKIDPLVHVFYKKQSSNNGLGLGIVWTTNSHEQQTVKGLTILENVDLNQKTNDTQFAYKLDIIYPPKVFLDDDYECIQKIQVLVTNKFDSSETPLFLKVNDDVQQGFYLDGLCEKKLRLPLNLLEFEAHFYEPGLHDLNVFQMSSNDKSYQSQQQYFVQVQEPLLI